MKKLKNWLILQKEGIIGGAILAGLIYYFNWSIPYISIQATGWYKLAILILLFSTGGALIDSAYKPGK